MIPNFQTKKWDAQITHPAISNARLAVRIFDFVLSKVHVILVVNHGFGG